MRKRQPPAKTVKILYFYQNDIWREDYAPEIYTKVTLIQKDYKDGLDLMWAQAASNVTVGFLVLGHHFKNVVRDYANGEIYKITIYNKYGDTRQIEGNYSNVFTEMQPEEYFFVANEEQAILVSGNVQYLTRGSDIKIQRRVQSDGKYKMTKYNE